MAKKAAKKAAKKKDQRLDLKGELPTSDTRNYLVRGIEGRDGNGPCKIITEGVKVRMPNGDLAMTGDTFDAIVEQLSPARFRSLVKNKYITAPKDYEDKLLKVWNTKSGPECDKVEGESDPVSDGGGPKKTK